MTASREITRSDFDEYFPVIKEILSSSDFIAFDEEFSGISSSTPERNSLFDTSAERYLTVKNNINNFIISQFGLTAFKLNHDVNKYTATTFVFYIFPRSVGALERTFLVESAAFEFLSKNDFDFNKLVRDGIGYVSVHDSLKLNGLLKDGRSSQLNAAYKRAKRNLKTSALLCESRGVALVEEMAIEDELLRIGLWLSAGREEADMLEGNIVSDREEIREILIEEIQTKFPVKIHVEIVENNGMVYIYQSWSQEKYKTELINRHMGFTRLFRLLSELRKPIVGHNPLLDLMLMYKEFNGPLPNSYEVFKKEIHRLFPLVYDTKHISYNLRQLLSRDLHWESNNLVDLYVYFKSGCGSYIANHSPDVVGVNLPPAKTTDLAVHEAGWDSYYTGFCFVKMMHYFAVQANMRAGMGARPLSSKQHLHCIQDYCNCINIPRANVSHWCLDRPDPVSEKPVWLVVESFESKPVDMDDVMKQVSSVVNADVKALCAYRVLIAVSTRGAVDDVFKRLAGSDYRIQTYSSMKHSAMVRKILWSGSFLTVTAFSMMLWLKIARNTA